MRTRESFSEHYASLPQVELDRICLDIKNLVPEARTALRLELERRHLSVKTIDWTAHPPRPKPRPVNPGLVGDAAGEHRYIERGRYHAWIHVLLAFLAQAFLLYFASEGVLEKFLSVETSELIGFFVGFGLTFAIYWNRWLCIEAYASESCSGIFNLSMFYVPLVVVCYANYRGFKKLAGR